jgi:hypothetical protein
MSQMKIIDAKSHYNLSKNSRIHKILKLLELGLILVRQPIQVAEIIGRAMISRLK